MILPFSQSSTARRANSIEGKATNAFPFLTLNSLHCPHFMFEPRTDMAYGAKSVVSVSSLWIDVFPLRVHFRSTTALGDFTELYKGRLIMENRRCPSIQIELGEIREESMELIPSQ